MQEHPDGAIVYSGRLALLTFCTQCCGGRPQRATQDPAEQRSTVESKVAYGVLELARPFTLAGDVPRIFGGNEYYDPWCHTCVKPAQEHENTPRAAS